MDSRMDAVAVILISFSIGLSSAVAEDAYGDPQLGCGGTVIAEEGTNATLIVTFDVGDRPTVSHVLTIYKPGHVGNAQPWITCTWLSIDEYNHSDACKEHPRISKILDHTYQLSKTIPQARKKDNGSYSVSLKVTTHQKQIGKKCDIVLLVKEASRTITTTEDQEIHTLHMAGSKSGSGQEESESNVAPVVIAVLVTALGISLFWLGAFFFYKRRTRRSLTSVKTEGGSNTAVRSHEGSSSPQQEKQNDLESSGLLSDSNHYSNGRTSSPSPVAGNGLAHSAPEEGSAGSTNVKTSLMPSTVRQRSRGSDETAESC